MTAQKICMTEAAFSLAEKETGLTKQQMEAMASKFAGRPIEIEILDDAPENAIAVGGSEPTGLPSEIQDKCESCGGPAFFSSCNPKDGNFVKVICINCIPTEAELADLEASHSSEAPPC